MTSVRISALQIGVIVLTLTTAAIHLQLGFFQVSIGMVGGVMFLANAAGYIGLLAALYLSLPINFIAKNRALVRWGLIAFAIVTILAWLVMGDKSLPDGLVGYITKAIEVVLIALLWIEARQQ